jgi:predicted ATPase/class 3 adenylate cyclase
VGRTPGGVVGDGPSGSDGGGSNPPLGDRRASAAPLPSGIVTFAMTDIEGSTRLFRELGERYVELLATHQALLRGPFVNHGGVEVGTEGDALFFVFADASEAVAACLEGQRALATQPWPPGAEVRVRIGLHTSEATPVGHDYVDLAVHQVARISAGAHGGQVLLSEATATAVEARLPVGAGLVPLGAFQLRGFPEPQRLFQLAHPDLRSDFPPLRLIGVVAHNLPFVRAGFVGRTEERAALASLLSTEGVVSVVGLGGVGKTRLAIQVAFDVMGRFPDGAWLVELASLSDPASVPRAVAEATRVAEQPGRSIDDVLVEALADKVALLVLDSCEHLLDAVAAIAERLSRHCPHLVILATSREPLDIEGEAVWRVSPLAIVDPNRVEGAAEVASADAVRLFVERARSANPQFELTDDNATDVARIVAQLNGIPLAIELAAAALGDRPLSGVLNGLADRFSLLTHGRRTAPPRHQTLRAALEWSLDLLQSGERRLFARLAVFAGGGTTEAIADVCGGPPDVEGDVPRILRHLARASLLVPHPELPERWSMLESVRQLAAIELEAAGEDDDLAARHRTWFALRVERVEADIGRAGRPEVMRDLAADQDNVRRAVDSAIAAGDAAVALRICTAMAPFWTSHGDWTEGCERLRAAVDLPGGGDPRLRGPALVALGNLLLLRGDLAEAVARFAEGRRLATEAMDDVVLARALAGEGYLAFRRSRLGEAQAMWEEALEKAERAGDERVAAGILRSLAIAAGSSGLQDRAGDLLRRAIALARRTGDDQQLRLLLGSAAEMHLWLGDYQAAENSYGDALALASAIGDLSARPLLLAELGWVALLQGAVVTAERLSIEAAELAEDLGNRRARAHALRLKGEALLRSGDPDAAATALGGALAVAEELGAPAEVAGVRCSQACLALEEERPVEARRLAGEATALSALSHPMRRVSLRWVLGTAALMEGDLVAAEREFRTDLESALEGQIIRHQANSLWGMARVSAAAGGVSRAAELHQRALALRHRMGDRLGVVDSFVGLATVVAPAEPEGAARLVGAAIALRAGTGATPTRREAAEVAAALAAIGDVADPRLVEVAQGAGAELDEDTAVAMAVRLGASTDDGMPDQATTARRHWQARG